MFDKVIIQLVDISTWFQYWFQTHFSITRALKLWNGTHSPKKELLQFWIKQKIANSVTNKVDYSYIKFLYIKLKKTSQNKRYILVLFNDRSGHYISCRKANTQRGKVFTKLNLLNSKSSIFNPLPVDWTGK